MLDLGVKFIYSLYSYKRVETQNTVSLQQLVKLYLSSHYRLTTKTKMIPRPLLLSLIFAFGQIQTANAAEKTNQPAPHCTVSSISDSQSYNLQQFKGKVVYVDFWASWCSPCLQSFPFMNKLEQEFKDKGLQILAINMDEDLADAQEFLTKQPAKFKVVTDGKQDCAKAFNVKAMPSSYLIDRNGVIRYEHLGFRGGETQELQNLIKQLLLEPAGKN